VGLARDGDEAVRVAHVTRPDVVVLDVVMPKRNGLDAARMLLTASPTSALRRLQRSQSRNESRDSVRLCDSALTGSGS
jgi:chemotaxis response regulator CheB